MKRDAFRLMVETQLVGMGYPRRAMAWAGSRLLLIVGGEFKELPLQTNMKRVELYRWLGRAAGWADVLGLTPEQVA